MPKERDVSQYVDSLNKPCTNYMVDGKCNKCIECCTVILPLSRREYKNIRKLFKKEFTEAFLEQLQNGNLNLVCPFASDEGCSIYSQRPEICRRYHCDGSNCPPRNLFTGNVHFLYELYGAEAKEIFEELHSLKRGKGDMDIKGI